MRKTDSKYNGRTLVVLMFAVVAGIVITSCRSSAPLSAGATYYTGDEIYERLIGNEPDIRTLSAARMNLRLSEDGGETNLRGSLRMARDSAIMISINAIAGIEAARILITRDSVKIIDRINNQYYLGDHDDAGKILPFNVEFDFLQDMLLGSSLRVFDTYGQLVEPGVRYAADADGMTFSSGVNLNKPGSNSEGDMLRVVLGSDFTLRDLELYSPGNDIYTRLRYTSFTDAGGYRLPDEIDFYLINGDVPISANIRLNRIELNRELSFPFNVPSRYKPF